MVGRGGGRRSIDEGVSTAKWEEIEGTMEKQREVEVFIVRESGESANAARHARRGHAKPDGAAPGPEAVRGAYFTRTHIIINY